VSSISGTFSCEVSLFKLPTS